jgi:hypothetical protein
MKYNAAGECVCMLQPGRRGAPERWAAERLDGSGIADGRYHDSLSDQPKEQAFAI